MFSVTQIGVYASAIGAILTFFHVNISTPEIQQALEAVLTIGGLVVAWYGRYRKGDLTIVGTRKK